MRGIRKTFYHFYWKLQKIIAPALQNSQYNYRDTLKSYLDERSLWLDLGCGHQILPEWIPSSQEEQSSMVSRSGRVVGLDYSYASMQKQKYIKNKVVGDIPNLPFHDCSFNIVTANMVVEHIENPNRALAEVHRILEPNGVFIFHTANLLSYGTLIAFIIPERIRSKLIEFLEGRKGEDVFPTFYKMNSYRTLNHLVHTNGFEILELSFVESSAETVMLGPLVIFELLIIRMLRFKSLAQFRSNIIAVLQKRGFEGTGAE
jgi:ubiquinone/menaquinone biosynthesis C-methylase UbiE